MLRVQDRPCRLTPLDLLCGGMLAGRPGVRPFHRPGNSPILPVILLEVHDMSTDNGDELTRIVAKHREDVAAARAAAEQRARNDENARHGCDAPLRGVALPLLREWSKRLSAEGYPTSVEDRLGCRPASLVFRLAPHKGPESSLTLACEAGPAVRFRMNVDGKNVGADLQTPLAELQPRIVLEGLGRFVTAALEAAIPRRSDCGP
jgi:hypothetical protein